MTATEINMAGGRQQIDLIFAALGVFSTSDGIEIGLENTGHNLISVIVIIAELGGAVEQQLAGAFIVRKIRLEDAEKGFHIECPLIVDMVANGGQGIGHRAQTNSLDIGGVVARAAVVVVLALGNAVVDQQR